MRTPYHEALQELENGLFEHDIRVEEQGEPPYEYTDEDFRACMKIFMSSCMWKLWEKQEKENIDIEKRMKQAFAFGNLFYKLVLKHLGIDSHKLYGENEK